MTREQAELGQKIIESIEVFKKEKEGIIDHIKEIGYKKIGMMIKVVHDFDDKVIEDKIDIFNNNVIKLYNDQFKIMEDYLEKQLKDI